MITTHYSGNTGRLLEQKLETFNGRLVWSLAEPFGADDCVAPAMAVLNGEVHLVCASLAGHSVRHLVRKPSGRWERAVGPDGKDVETPGLGNFPGFREGYQSPWPHPGLALTVHDGQLHMVLGKTDNYPTLHHCVFDGRAWSDPEEPIEWRGASEDDPRSLQTGQGAALASYAGKLHAVYPSTDENWNLRHTTWTKDNGWSAPEVIESRRSDHTPALLTIKDAGSSGEALLLIHRGVTPSR
ncbi:hypothetical protein, partial [Streptomyces violascens]|uniref:hypothetical protein n=1 Tax=Streptomyces violascens TaxID=67381 RepID=UPI0036B22458